MIEINSPSLEQSLDFCEVTLSTIYCVLAGVVLECMTSHHQMRIWNDFKGVWARLNNTPESSMGLHSGTTYQVDNLTKMNLNTAFVKIGVLCGIVDELGELSLTHFRRAVAEDKQKGIDGIRFSRTVWPDDG